MSKSDKIYYEDIDLIGILFDIWRGKATIIFFSLITVIFGGLYLWINDKNIKVVDLYETKLWFSVENLPIDITHPTNPYSTEGNVLIDFENFFYSKENFNKWKNENPQTSISFERLIDYKFINGLTVKKNQKEISTFFEILETNENYIHIFTDKISEIVEIYEYSNYITNLINKKYTLLLKKDYEILKNKIEEFINFDLRNLSSDFIYKSMMIEKYITSVEAGINIIDIKHVNEPKKIKKQPKGFTYMKLIILAFLGFIVGAFYLVCLNAIKDRKNRL